MIKVNLGCGLTIADGWDNYDNSPNALISKIPFLKYLLYKTGLISKFHYDIKWDKKIIYRDLRKPLPYKDNSVDFIYTSHFLEHISKDDFILLISEIYRILKPGTGVFRIVMPDLNYYIMKYIDMKKAKSHLAADIFMESIRVFSKGRDPHLWMYDSESVKYKLSQIGYVDVLDCRFRQGECEDIEKLDNRPDDSFWIEAKK